MTGSECKQALAQGKTLCGTLIVSPSPKWPKYLGKCGLDFVFIDTEHVALDLYTLSNMCMLYAANHLAPVVRIPSPDPYMASQVLDAGAHGILAPYIETAQQVRDLVGAVHYKPVKGEMLRQALAGEAPLPAKDLEQMRSANKDHLLFVNIESKAGMAALDEILAVSGLDGIVIGPNDLSFSLGNPNDYESEEFHDAVIAILKKARARNVAAGIHYMGDISRQIEWAKETGMNLLFHSGDMYIFVENLRKDLNAFRESLGFEEKAAEAVDIII